MVKLYTKQGDAGETGLLGGARVPKDDLRIEAIGDIDELNATIGLALASMGADLKPLSDILDRVQHELFILGEEMASTGTATPKHHIEAKHVARLEDEIDMLTESMTRAGGFVLPRGGVSGSHLHVARTVARRAERSIRRLHREHPLRPEDLAFINRISDMLYAMALTANSHQNIPETPLDYSR
jgi:cob(I)alamin adenosyltransferase